MNKNPKEIILELNSKFGQNFKSWSALKNSNLEKTFIGLQCIAAVGETLTLMKSSKHHEICCKIYDEIFSDGISAIYLATMAMDKPANIVLRRIIELGITAVYLWDMPHMAYSWKDHDHDLSFSDMLNHVNSKGYLAYITSENLVQIESDLFPASECQKIYGTLSDIVHGKITTFESSMPDRFVFCKNDWNDFVTLIEKIVDILVRAYLIRYEIAEKIFQKIPRARKEFN